MIRSISIDKFGDIDSLQLQLKKFHKMDVSSGGDSLLTMLLALSQSFLPGYAYDWQNVARPGESSFGNGKLAVRGKMFDGGTFAKCLRENSPYCSCMIEFVIENPENPVEDAGTLGRNDYVAAEPDEPNAGGQDGERAAAKPDKPDTGGKDGERAAAEPDGFEAGVQVGARVAAESDKPVAGGAMRNKRIRPPFADRKRAGADDFRELCRLFGEKFANVKRFVLGTEVTFAQKNDDNILSYQLVSIRCERVWDEDITSFFELVLYRNGTNYDLYWDELPDIRGTRTSGRAKGCNVRMRNLAVLDIVSDGVQDGACFEEVLPSVVRISRIAADQFGTLRFLLDVGQKSDWDSFWGSDAREPDRDSGYGAGAQEPNYGSGSHVEAKEPDQNSGCRTKAQIPMQGPCYYVGAHGEYTDTVVRTYTEGKIRVAWPDPATGEIRHGLFEEAYEIWKRELGSEDGNPFRDESEKETGSPCLNWTGAEEAALVQGLILRTGETLVLRGDVALPEKFFEFLSRMGRQIVIMNEDCCLGS